jgi:hypothetical protein
MEKQNKIILALASLQAAILVNATAYDDDLSSTWQQLKEDYENVKIMIDRYIEEDEEDFEEDNVWKEPEHGGPSEGDILMSNE